MKPPPGSTRPGAHRFHQGKLKQLTLHLTNRLLRQHGLKEVRQLPLPLKPSEESPPPLGLAQNREAPQDWEGGSQEVPQSGQGSESP
jgi:hypothetical protein